MGKAEKTRRFIIEKTARLFNIKGYANTSLSDITGGTGLTKGSIYGNFENKESVMLAAYDHNVQKVYRLIDEAIEAKDLPQDKLMAMLQAFKTQWKLIDQLGGCPILNAAIETDDHLYFMHSRVQASFRHWADQIKSILAAGVRQQAFRKVDQEKYAYLMIAQLEGGILLSKTFHDAKYLHQSIAHITQIIEKEILLNRKVTHQETFRFTKLFNTNHEKSSYNRLRRYYTTGQYRRFFLGSHTTRKKRRGTHHKI